MNDHRPGLPIRYNPCDPAGGCRRDSAASAAFFAAGRSSAWLERLVWDQEVACSNHVAPTKESSLETRGFRRFWADGRKGGKTAGAMPGQFRAPEAFGPALQHARWGTTFAPLVAPVHHRRSEGSATSLRTGECGPAERGVTVAHRGAGDPRPRLLRSSTAGKRRHPTLRPRGTS